MKSNSLKVAPISPVYSQENNNFQLIHSKKIQTSGTVQSTKKAEKMRNRQTQGVLSPLKTGLNQTGISVLTKATELNQSLSALQNKKGFNPKVSNYSEDLNLMMESYFIKKLKEIRENISQLNPIESKGRSTKKNPPPRVFSPKSTIEGKNPISVVNKAIQSKDKLNDINGTKQNKKPTVTKLLKNKITPSDNHCHPHEERQSNQSKSTERRNRCLSFSKEKINQTKVIKCNMKKQINVVRNKLRFSGAKFEYYRNDKCVHTVSVDRADLNNFASISKSLQEFFYFAFKREVEVSVAFKNAGALQEHYTSSSFRESNIKRQEEGSMHCATMPNDQSEIMPLRSSPQLQERELNEPDLAEELSQDNDKKHSLVEDHIKPKDERDLVNDKVLFSENEMKHSLENDGIEIQTEVLKENQKNDEKIPDIKEQG